jgi:protease I
MLKALIMTADGFDDLQFFYPWYRLQEEGIQVTLASPGSHTLQGKHGYRVEPDMPLHEVNPAEYDLLYIPGGEAPERLRLRERAVDIARTFMEEDRRVATLCHGAQLLISAGALNGRTVTCAAGIRDDVKAAGATYRDEAVVNDSNLLSGRATDDLPQFCHQLVAVLTARVG